MEDFRRYDSRYPSGPQYFIEKNLPVCPFCGKAEPLWTIASRQEGYRNVLLFRCSHCGGILTIGQERVLRGNEPVPAGAQANELKMKILFAGDHCDGAQLEGGVLTLGELKVMASNSYNKAQTRPVQPIYQPAQNHPPARIPRKKERKYTLEPTKCGIMNCKCKQINCCLAQRSKLNNTTSSWGYLVSPPPFWQNIQKNSGKTVGKNHCEILYNVV